jgi:hypothetical protein
LISLTTYKVDPVGLGIKRPNIDGVIEREISSDYGFKMAAEFCRL